MQIIPVVFLNGSFVFEDNAKIPVSDRGFLYGDGVFTTLKVKDGHIEFYARHLDRLYTQCHALGISPPDISMAVVQELIERNAAFNGSWRLKIVVTGGGDPGLHLHERPWGQLLITLNPYQGHGGERRLTIYPFALCRPSSAYKSLSYLDRLCIAQHAIQVGFDDAILTDTNGFLLETAFSNIFWRVDACIFTPDFELPLLCGVTIEVVCDAARRMGMHLCRVRQILDNIPQKAQFFLCNSLKGVVPVTAIDHRKFSRDHYFETELAQAFREFRE